MVVVAANNYLEITEDLSPGEPAILRREIFLLRLNNHDPFAQFD